MGNANTYSFPSVEAALEAGHTQEEIDEYLKNYPEIAHALARSAEEVSLAEFVKNKFTEFMISEDFANVFTPDAVVIRATGNPAVQQTWKDMVDAGNIKVHKNEVLNIHRLKLLSHDHKVGLVVCTIQQNFEFKGEKNEDTAVYSITAVRTKHGWRVAHAHRSTGRKVGEPLPDFSAVE